MEDLFKFLMPLEQSKLLNHVASNCMEVKEFYVFGGCSFSGPEQPLVFGLDKGPMLWLVHRRQEDCRIAVIGYPRREGFIFAIVSEVTGGEIVVKKVPVTMLVDAAVSVGDSVRVSVLFGYAKYFTRLVGWRGRGRLDIHGVVRGER